MILETDNAVLRFPSFFHACVPEIASIESGFSPAGKQIILLSYIRPLLEAAEIYDIRTAHSKSPEPHTLKGLHNMSSSTTLFVAANRTLRTWVSCRCYSFIIVFIELQFVTSTSSRFLELPEKIVIIVSRGSVDLCFPATFLDM